MLTFFFVFVLAFLFLQVKIVNVIGVDNCKAPTIKTLTVQSAETNLKNCERCVKQLEQNYH